MTAIMIGQKVLVPTSAGDPLHGTITDEEWDSFLDKHVLIVEFPSGYSARLTESEVVRVSERSA